MEVRVLPEAGFFQWARSGKIGHALALVGLFYAKMDDEVGDDL